MKLALIVVVIMTLLFFGVYQKTLIGSAAMCIVSEQNANGDSEDVAYMLRFGEGITPGQNRKATREEYHKIYSEASNCDASYTHEGGYYKIIDNGSRSLNRLTIGFGSTKAAALADALKKMGKYDEGWDQDRNGFNSVEEGTF